MRPPFPGMDPWLEHPDLWLDLHNSLITSIRDAIVPKVAPNYYVGIEQRTYESRPGAAVYRGPARRGRSPGRARRNRCQVPAK